MRILALDAATAMCSAAVLDDGRVVAHRLERLGRGHAERLLPMVLEVLADAGLGFSALDRLAVTIGPGTFTGVRIGLATARGLALAADRPLIGVTTLETLAFDALAFAAEAQSVAAVVAAGRGRVYVQVFGPDLAPAGPPAALELAEAARR
ncbi:MAG: tRNA (adenosine(37)-N6)-threonylcarbamoyltransferase complex dimerization subunit type 1 TsaB, partial [Alphaproteobacteria bacterium]